MRRIGKRGSRSERGRKPTPIAVFDGSLRNLHDATGIDVTLSLSRGQTSGGQITVISDDGEMGTWTVGSVAIRSFDSTSYEFYADGDLLLFTPDDLVGFRASPFVVGLPPETGQRKRGISKKKQPGLEPTVVKAPKTKKPAAKKTKKKPVVKKTKAKLPVVKRKKPRGKSVADPTSAETPEIPPRSERHTTPEVDAPAPASEVEPTPAVPEPARAEPVVDEEPLEVPVAPEPEQPEPVAVVEPVEVPRRSIPESEAVETNPEPEPVGTAPANGRMRNTFWIRALDSARRYDLFDLNRVPIDRSLRGREHQHTWDHRVATAEGVAGRVCTICGKVRFSTKSARRSRRSKR